MNIYTQGTAFDEIQSAPFSASSDLTVVSAVANTAICVFAVKGIADASVTVSWKSGSTALEGSQTYAAGTGYVEHVTPPHFLFRTAVGEALVLAASGGGTFAGRISYVLMEQGIV